MKFFFAFILVCQFLCSTVVFAHKFYLFELAEKYIDLSQAPSVGKSNDQDENGKKYWSLVKSLPRLDFNSEDIEFGIYTKSIAAKTFPDNRYVEFKFPDLLESKGKVRDCLINKLKEDSSNLYYLIGEKRMVGDINIYIISTVILTDQNNQNEEILDMSDWWSKKCLATNEDSYGRNSVKGCCSLQ